MANLKKFLSIIFTLLISINMIIGSVNAAAVKGNNGERSLLLLEHNQFHQLPSLETDSNFRRKRALVFRPLFVYKEQEVRRQKLKEERRMAMQHHQQRQQQAQG